MTDTDPRTLELAGDEQPPRQRPVLAGALAGLIGISCCVYPVVLVLLGLSTAAAAADLGNLLFDEWGWAFRLAGLTLAGVAIFIQRRRALACPVDRRPRWKRSVVIMLGVAVATYAALYAVTSGLEAVAT
jgi:hypothetical protein